LAKLVEAEAAVKRGEGVSPGAVVDSAQRAGSLLANSDATDQKAQQEEAKRKLQAARSGSDGGGSAGVLQPKAKLASSLSGASRLLVISTWTLGTLRKSLDDSNLLKKKGSLGGASKSKPRINQLCLSVEVPQEMMGMIISKTINKPERMLQKRRQMLRRMLRKLPLQRKCRTVYCK
jgi:hypothetical protein